VAVPPVFTDDAPTQPVVAEPVTSPLPVVVPEPAAEQREGGTEPAASEESRWVTLAKGVRRQLPYSLVLLTMVIGLLRIVQYHWREGSAWIGGALLLAALLRAILPPRTAGMVAVRGRAIDVLWCTGLAVCILFVAYTLKA
jgi:hypothetical protein